MAWTGVRSWRSETCPGTPVAHPCPAGQPVDPETSIRLQVMLEDLAWWSSALEKARAAGELIPGTLRARAALAAVQA